MQAMLRGSVAVAFAALAVAMVGEATRAYADPGTVHSLKPATASIPTPLFARRHTSIAPPGPHIIPGNLGTSGGPVQTAPIVYVVYWGWTSDPSGEQPYLNSFLSNVGGTPWLNAVMQYSSAGNPTNLFGGSLSDPTLVPAQPTDADIQQEASFAVSYFGLGNTLNVQIVVATPTGHSTAGFNSTFCAYHGHLPAYPNVSYTNLPYMTDGGFNCGANWVRGPLDGVSIVEGHELAESITDPLLNAWYDASGNEIADKCAWVNVAAINTSGGTFAVQPLWSNADGGCVMTSNPAGLPWPFLSDSGSGIACPSDTLSWATVPGAASYQIWFRQTLPITPYFYKLYSGTATHLRVTLAPNTAFTYMASACSAAGWCSTLSNGVQVRYGSRCL